MDPNSGAERLQVADLFRDLRPRSRASLGEALRLLSMPGVGATLVVQIPADITKPCEIVLSTGPTQLVVNLTGMH